MNAYPQSFRTSEVYFLLLTRYDGQEAVLTGIEAALTKQDSIVTSYRDHCHHISRGGTIQEVMAELFGRATGATKGEIKEALFKYC